MSDFLFVSMSISPSVSHGYHFVDVLLDHFWMVHRFFEILSWGFQCCLVFGRFNIILISVIVKILIHSTNMLLGICRYFEYFSCYCSLYVNVNVSQTQL